MAIGTGLENELRTLRIKRLVICVATINQCVETTSLLTGDVGTDTYRVRAAVCPFDRSDTMGMPECRGQRHDDPGRSPRRVRQDCVQASHN